MQTICEKVIELNQGIIMYKVEIAAFHITYACNHNCPMCYASETKRQGHYPISQINRVVDELKRQGVREISLLGGDPALHPNIMEILENIKKNGLKVSILSNTHSYDDINKISKFLNAVESTFHHYLPEKHDDFCKHAGAFDNLIANLTKFQKNNIPIGVVINAVPDSSNLFFKIVDTLIAKYKLNINYLIVQRIIPFGKAKKSSDFAINKKEVEFIWSDIQKIRNKYKIKIIVEDPVPLCILPRSYRDIIEPCQWGINKVSINGNGDLSRCGADPRYQLGNIFEKPLVNIWNESSVLVSFREKKYLPGRCHVCSMLNKCGGGCPLSCEIDKDHGLDYLYFDFENLTTNIHGNLKFAPAEYEELSSILQLEWANFSDFANAFSVDSIKKWYKHNPNMFWVVKDTSNWILGYVVLVPVSERLYNDICNGQYSALVEFSEQCVQKTNNSAFYHIEVLAKIPNIIEQIVGSFLIKNTGTFLVNNAKYITATPMTEVGLKLCNFFDFTYCSSEEINGKQYPIYRADINDSIIQKIRKF
jgi:radical SAM protein with 4Fe4S-binding SPASM domain